MGGLGHVKQRKSTAKTTTTKAFAKRIMTIQLYKDNTCADGKEIDKAVATFTMDATKWASGSGAGTYSDNTDKKCHSIPVKEGKDKLWYQGNYKKETSP